MRCIEIYRMQAAAGSLWRLIETWDVLKFTCACKTGFNWLRLIETWDVLKWLSNALSTAVLNRLIETWDVLKYEFLHKSKKFICD